MGSYFYVNNNQLVNLDALVMLQSVNGNLNISNNQLTDVNGVANLSTISGAMQLSGNSGLIDISGFSSIVSFDGKKIYLDNHEYTIKASLSDAFCSSVWDIYDTNGNTDDNMALICEGYIYQPSDEDKLRDLLGKKYTTDSLAFYNNFNVATGVYGDNVSCQNIIDEEISSFMALLGVDGDFSIENSPISTLNELIRLQLVTGSLSIKNNANLNDIQGLSNVVGSSGAFLYIDDTSQYSVKADGEKDFCQSTWDIYIVTGNITDDMTKVCLYP